VDMLLPPFALSALGEHVGKKSTTKQGNVGQGIRLDLDRQQ
jgi:hypothetical protein